MKLKGSDLDFFTLVSKCVFINPFSDERMEMNRKILGEDTRALEDDVEALSAKVSARLKAPEEPGGRLSDYSNGDLEIMRLVFIFAVYYRVYRDLDAYIQAQIDGGTPSASFGKTVLSELAERGFDEGEAVNIIGMFYQIRRSQYFVSRSLIGTSAPMKELRRHLWNNVFTHDIRWYYSHFQNRMEDFSTLFLGETGTGKGTAASAVGRSGFIPFDPKSGTFVEDFASAFVSLNLSQFAETLVESELFGHRKGAFTGAIADYEGIFSRCSARGSIFLDEIGDTPAPIQLKLLQVLQERTFTPVGSHESKRFRGRVIAATNRSLDELRGDGLFRDDFYYRLCSDTITVPPLRERLQDDPSEMGQLLHHILVRMTASADVSHLIDEVQGVIESSVGSAYRWPGNVRELEQAVRQILLTGKFEGDPYLKAPAPADRLVTGLETGQLSANECLGLYSQRLYEQLGSYEKVARRLGLDRRTVKRYMDLLAE